MAEKKTSAVDIKRDKTPTAMQGAGEWDPFRVMRQTFGRMVPDVDWPDFRFSLPHRTFEHLKNWPDLDAMVPPVDLVERNGNFEVQVELPGLTQDQIEVKLAGGMMTIKGEKSSEKVEDDENYHLRERSYGSFQRSFRLPDSVDVDKVSALFENGVLKVTLPKSATAMQKERKIDIKAA
jgi:HSP20 family protein